MIEKRIVVVGAGVAGLTTALLLSRNVRYSITVAAKHMPGDYDIEYASPWAGANYVPASRKLSSVQEWEMQSWEPLAELARNNPEAGIHFQRSRLYIRTKDAGSTPSAATAAWLSDLGTPRPWYKDVDNDFQEISKDQLRPGIASAREFTSVCINTAIYLPWLVSQCLKNGVIFKRAVFQHIADAAAPGCHHSGKAAELVVNCTGLAAYKLGGVEDKLMFPARGQVVVVRNVAPTMVSVSSTDDGPEEVCYIMTRAAGGGTILGGCYQKGSWESQPDLSLAVRIMKRSVELCPELTGGKGIDHLDIIRHGVGLRPGREGGTRIEKEKINGVWTVHNYGAGGGGYQTSYGCSQAAMKLVDEVFWEKYNL